MLNRPFAAAALLCYAFSAQAADSPFSQAFIERMYEKVTPALCLISYSYEVTDPSTGNRTKNSSNAVGLIVTQDGVVMARGHVAIENTEPFNIRVQVGELDDEEEYDARLLEKPEDVNVVFLRILPPQPRQFPFVKMTPGPELKIGEPLLLFGMLGRALDNAKSIFVRRVGAIIERPRTTYCLDEPLPLGFIGAPALTSRGEIVGVIGFDLTPQEGGELYTRSGHPLLYQTSLFARYIDSPPTAEGAGRPEGWLGVFTQPLTEELAEYWSLPQNGGIVVSTVMAGSPAETAGIQRGDVLVEFAGSPLRAKLNREVIGFTKLVRETPMGVPVSVKLLREGQPMEVQLTLTERPKTARQAEQHDDPLFGMDLREITTDLRIRANLAQDVQGVVVFHVRSGSWAQLSGIRAGMIIMNFGGYPVTNLEDYRTAVAKVTEAKPSEVTVFCRVRQATAFFRIQPRWAAQN